MRRVTIMRLGLWLHIWGSGGFFIGQVYACLGVHARKLGQGHTGRIFWAFAVCLLGLRCKEAGSWVHEFQFTQLEDLNVTQLVFRSSMRHWISAHVNIEGQLRLVFATNDHSRDLAHIVPTSNSIQYMHIK